MSLFHRHLVGPSKAVRGRCCNNEEWGLCLWPCYVSCSCWDGSWACNAQTKHPSIPQTAQLECRNVPVQDIWYRSQQFCQRRNRIKSSHVYAFHIAQSGRTSLLDLQLKAITSYCALQTVRPHYYQWISTSARLCQRDIRQKNVNLQVFHQTLWCTLEVTWNVSVIWLYMLFLILKGGKFSRPTATTSHAILEVHRAFHGERLVSTIANQDALRYHLLHTILTV